MVQHPASDFTATVEKAKHKHGVVGFDIAMKNNIWEYDAYANGCTQFGARCATFGKLLQTPIERIKIRVVTRGNIRARLGRKIIDDGGGIGVCRRGDDNARHLASERSKPRRHARPVFLEGENIAARNIRLCFIDEGLCPREIVLFDFAFGKTLVQQGSRGLLN
jgi:hypothetical protein